MVANTQYCVAPYIPKTTYEQLEEIYGAHFFELILVWFGEPNAKI